MLWDAVIPGLGWKIRGVVSFSSSAQQHRDRNIGGGECLDRSKVGKRPGGAGREGACCMNDVGKNGKGTYWESHHESFQNRKGSHKQEAEELV